MWNQEAISEKTKEEYFSKNTLWLTPQLLREYLIQVGFIKDEDERDDEEKISKEDEFTLLKEEINSFISFLLKNPSRDEFINVVTEKPQFINFFVTIALESYEFLARLLLVLDYKFKEGKIKDPQLKRLINTARRGRSLPTTSISLKKSLEKRREIRKLLAFIIYKMFFEDFGEYYMKNIDNGEIHKFISMSLPQFYEKISVLKTILNLIDRYPDIRTSMLEILFSVYLAESKGMLKAKEGYQYEEVLKEVLDYEGIPHELEEEHDSNEEDETTTRKWDIYIPNKQKPKIVIEVMYMITTSSGMTNKRKVIIEESKKQKIKIFVLMDGAGWIARWSDAKKLLEADVYVFTFHKDSLGQALEKIKEFLAEDKEE